MIGIAVGATVLLAASFGIWGVAICLLLSIFAAFRAGPKTLCLFPLALLSCWWVVRAAPPDAAPALIDQSTWNLNVTSMPLSRERGYIFDAVITKGEGTGLQVWVMSYGDAPIGVGDRLYASGTFKPLSALDDGFDAYVRGRGDSGELLLGWHTVDEAGYGPLAWIDRERQRLLQRLQNAVPGDAGVLLSGLVTGDDGRLSDQADQAFKWAGLSHLTAVSGANLSAITAMVLAVGAWSGRRRLAWLLGATGAAWIYAIAVGLSPPTLRAALVATGATGGRLAGRPVDLLTVTLLSGAFQIAIRPNDARSISFQLSMMASLGIVAALADYPPRPNRGFLSDALLATLYAQIATLPLVAWAFRDVPMLGLFANIVAAPLAAAAFPIGIVGALLLGVSPVIGTAMLVPAAFACRGLLATAHIYGRSWAVFSTPDLGLWILLPGLFASMLILLIVGGEGGSIQKSLQKRSIVGKIP